MGLGDALSGLGAGVGGAIGYAAGGKNRKRARKQYEQSVAELQGLNAEMGPTAMSGVTTDPRLRGSQLSALDALERRGREGGLALEDRAAYSEAANETARRERGSREAILQQFAMRGQAGQGLEAMAQLANSQGAADRNAATGLQGAADARARAYGAIAEAGRLGGAIRGQDFGEGAQKAQASDAVNRFNAGARIQKAGMVAGARQGYAGMLSGQAQQTTNLGAGIGAGVGGAVGGTVDYFTDPKKKAGG